MKERDNIKKLDNNELLEISGGSLSAGAWIAIGGGVVFLIGVIDGIVRPLACRS